MSEHYLGFGDRTVVLLQATADEIADTFTALDDIAELRRPHEVASLLAELGAAEQTEWGQLAAVPSLLILARLVDLGPMVSSRR